MEEFSVWHTALRIPCTFCGAEVGTSCVVTPGYPHPRGIHGARWEAARELVRYRMAMAVEQMTLPFE